MKKRTEKLVMQHKHAMDLLRSRTREVEGVSGIILELEDTFTLLEALVPDITETPKSTPAPKHTTFEGYGKSTIPAIEHFLRIEGKATTLRRIQEGLLDGGYGPGKSKALKYADVKRSVDYWTTTGLRLEESKRRLRVVRGWIGLYSWEDHYFPPYDPPEDSEQ